MKSKNKRKVLKVQLLSPSAVDKGFSNEILVGSIPDENKAEDETGCVGSQKNIKT